MILSSDYHIPKNLIGLKDHLLVKYKHNFLFFDRMKKNG
jgi:hypothetical protein